MNLRLRVLVQQPRQRRDEIVDGREAFPRSRQQQKFKPPPSPFPLAGQQPSADLEGEAAESPGLPALSQLQERTRNPCRIDSAFPCRIPLDPQQRAAEAGQPVQVIEGRLLRVHAVRQGEPLDGSDIPPSVHSVRESCLPGRLADGIASSFLPRHRAIAQSGAYGCRCMKRACTASRDDGQRHSVRSENAFHLPPLLTVAGPPRHRRVWQDISVETDDPLHAVGRRGKSEMLRQQGVEVPRCPLGQPRRRLACMEEENGHIDFSQSKYGFFLRIEVACPPRKATVMAAGSRMPADPDESGLGRQHGGKPASYRSASAGDRDDRAAATPACSASGVEPIRPDGLVQSQAPFHFYTKSYPCNANVKSRRTGMHPIAHSRHLVRI